MEINEGRGAVVQAGAVVMSSFPDDEPVLVVNGGHEVFAAGKDSVQFKGLFELQADEEMLALLDSDTRFPKSPKSGMRQAYVRFYGVEDEHVTVKGLMAFAPAERWTRVMVHLLTH